MSSDLERERNFYGYTPEFYRRVQARRRREARQEALRREREEAVAKEQRRIQAELAAEYEKQAAKARIDQEASELVEREDTVHPLAEDEIVVRRPAVEIVREVCSAFNVRFSEIVGKIQTPEVVRARQHAMYRLRTERPDMSFTQIARIFRKDHTTVIHSVRKVAAEMAA